MRKKSIITIMMLMTLSTVMFLGCNNDKKSKEEVKIETSVKENTDFKKIDSNKPSENKEKNNVKEITENKDKNKDNNESNIEKKNKISENVNFTPQKAIEIAKQKYGTQKGNILYSYKEEPYMSNGKKGYYIKLSSKTMIEQGGTGTLTWLLVTNDGKIIEDPKMN